MKYFFMAENNGELHIMVAKNEENAKELFVKSGLELAYMYELAEDTFTNEGIFMTTKAGCTSPDSREEKDMIGKYVIVRGNRSGVFAGVLKEKNGTEVTLSECRRLWYWSGAASISQLAKEGVKYAENCNFTVTVDEIMVTDAIEIIPCTPEAIANIKEVKEWKI